MVVSGKRCMAFYWQADQLVCRIKEMNEDSKLTSMWLPLRDPIALPNLDSLLTFLGKAILFTANLQRVRVLVDGEEQACIGIEQAEEPVAFPAKSQIWDRLFSDEIFLLQKAHRQKLIISFGKRYTSAKVRPANLMSRLWSKVVGPDALAELARQPGVYRLGCERYTGIFEVRVGKTLGDQMERVMKKRPSGRATISILLENDEGVDHGAIRHPILTALMPAPGEGRIFIGFETHQTTGLALHLLAPLVPTVERESLDLVTPSLRLWNEHCLRAARVLVRLAWDGQREAAGFARLLSLTPSTPSPVPGQLLLEGLLSGGDPSLPTQLGIMPASKVRRVPEAMRLFCPKVPRLDCPEALERLILASVQIPEMSLEDVAGGLAELEDEAAVRSCLDWMTNTPLDSNSLRRLTSQLRLPTDHGLRTLDQLAHYAPSDPAPFSLPPNCLAYKFQLRQWPRWLSPLPMVAFVSHQMKVTTVKADDLLCWVSVQWGLLNDLDRAQIASLLANLSLPCSDGQVRLPDGCFFESVPLSSLPRLALGNRRHLINDDLLRLMGVMGHIPVPELLSLPGMSLPQLVDYLVAVQGDLTEDEHGLIRETAFKDMAGEKRPLRELYLEIVNLSSLLKLPCLAWEGSRPLTEESEAGRFLIAHGLRPLPPVKILLGAVKEASAADRSTIFSHFIRNIDRYSQWQSLAFLPTISDQVVRPAECYAEGDCALLGFAVLHPALKPHAHLLGVAPVPEGDRVVKSLCELAFERDQFEAICDWIGRKIGLSRSHLHILSKTSFIPAPGDKNGWLTPAQVYFEVDESLSGIFTALQVESPMARSFLKQCGVGDQPSIPEIIHRLTEDPEGLLATVGVEGYLALLRKIASNGVSTDLQRRMASRPCLLAQRGESNEWCLAVPSSIYLDDDTISRQLFKPLMAPAEDALLQSLYRQLGVQWLSGAVSLRWTWSQPADGHTAAAHELAAEIAVRSQLLLSSFPGRLVPDAHECLAALQVKQVAKLEAVRSLSGYPPRQQTSTACLSPPSALIFSHPPDWFEVASALARLLLKDGKLPDCLMLSCLLTTSLTTLESMGFDVSVKRRQAEEPKVISSEIAATAMSEPKISAASVDQPPSETLKNAKKTQEESTSKPNRPAKTLELPSKPEKAPSPASQTKSLLGMLKHGLKGIMKSPSATVTPLPPNPTNHAHPARPDASIQSTLQQGVSACRPCRDEILEQPSQPTAPLPPQSQALTPTCHSLQGLRRIAVMHSLGIWIPRQADEPALLVELMPHINRFAPLQHRLAGLFNVSLGCVNLFWHPSTNVIAFNQGGTLFFSLAYHQQQADWSDDDLLVNWYLTWCHELAHNFCSAHDEMHEHWMMAYAEQYLKHLL